MRLRYWLLVFLLLVVASSIGAVAFLSNIFLLILMGFVFLVGVAGFIVLGIVFLVRLVIPHREKVPKSYRQNLPVPTYKGQSEYGVISRTLRGDTVRSYSEKVIADYLFQNGIRYVYEQPVFRLRGRRKMIGKPDFYLVDYGVHVEYWGLVDVRDEKVRTSYVKNMVWKKDQYRRNGVTLISLYRRDLDNLDESFRSQLTQVTGRTVRQNPVTRVCGSCGRSVYTGDRFCTSCGSSLSLAG